MNKYVYSLRGEEDADELKQLDWDELNTLFIPRDTTIKGDVRILYLYPQFDERGWKNIDLFPSEIFIYTALNDLSLSAKKEFLKGCFGE